MIPGAAELGYNTTLVLRGGILKSVTKDGEEITPTEAMCALFINPKAKISGITGGSTERYGVQVLNEGKKVGAVQAKLSCYQCAREEKEEEMFKRCGRCHVVLWSE